ncbi:MAG: hypothetical protein KBF12_12080 [Sebaldella sp.]|nr:hypothetical protein [Sebaldella sp.]
MFNPFKKKSTSKEEMGKVTLTKIEIIKYKRLLRAIIGNRGDTLYKFIDEYNSRNLKNINVEIRSTILKHHTYDTPEEFELDLFNTYFDELVLMYLQTKKYILSVDWKGEETNREIEKFVNERLSFMNEEEIKFKILDDLQEKIDNKVLCVYSSDFLMIKLKLIDNELKKIGYSLYIINNNSDTYHLFVAKTGVINEDEKIINFWSADIDDFEHNGLGRKINAAITAEKVKVYLADNKTWEIVTNTVFFINGEDEETIEIETINCDEIIKGRIPKKTIYDIIC